MKIRYALMGAALAVTLPTAVSAQQTSGFYLGGAAGLNILRDTDASLGALVNEIEAKNGFAGALSGGYAYGNGLRTELELGFRHNSVDKVNNFDADDGEFRSWSAMGNALYDINTGTRFTPYLGAGVGVARITADNVRPVVGGFVLDDSDTRFAYQGIAGVSYGLTDNLSVAVDYRYFATTNPDFGTTSDPQYRNHTVMAGLRWKFGAAPAPAPVPTPMPPAPAPVPPVQPSREYMVFFDFNSTDITPQSAQIITDAASSAKSTSTIRLEVTGHTDTSGSPTYNERLSKRRADAVKAELIRRGIPENQIVIAWRGESQPLVATADNIREPSNRRAQIVIVVR